MQCLTERSVRLMMDFSWMVTARTLSLSLLPLQLGHAELLMNFSSSCRLQSDVVFL